MQERDFFKEPFAEEELKALLGGLPASELFSWRSPSFKALGLEASSLSEQEMVRLMLQEPRLIRRPITRVGGALVIGSNERQLEQALAES